MEKIAPLLAWIALAARANSSVCSIEHFVDANTAMLFFLGIGSSLKYGVSLVFPSYPVFL
jgi:hypothetical protein